MMTARNAHLLDHELVALIDDDGDRATLAEYTAHLAECSTCRGEAHRLRRALAAVSKDLSTIDVSSDFALPFVPSTQLVRRRISRQLATAAGIVAVTILSFRATEPLHALAQRAWQLLASEDTTPRIEAVETPTTQGQPVRPIMLQFVPQGSTVLIDIAVLQTTGTLTIRQSRHEFGRIHFPAAVETLVSESTIEIRNTPEQSASYVVEVPANVRTVRARLAGREQAVAVPQSGAIVLDLSARGAAR